MVTTESTTSSTSIVYIGHKPLINYVLAVGKRLGECESCVLIKARGKSISKAVDVALITVDRSKDEVKVNGVDINTEVLPGGDGNDLNVSSIKISLGRI